MLYYTYNVHVTIQDLDTGPQGLYSFCNLLFCGIGIQTQGLAFAKPVL
jgi:hypothetical protein